MEAFKHHVRLVVEQELDTDLIKTYYNTVKEHLGETVQPNDENVTMVHHLMDDAHCYDINLAKDMDVEHGDIVAEALAKMIDEKMMNEIEGLKKNLKPHETLFVVFAFCSKFHINALVYHLLHIDEVLRSSNDLSVIEQLYSIPR